MQNGAVSHLGILVVYALSGESDIGLLELHLDRIARHTSTPYTLFAVTPRLAADAERVVRQAPNVVMCDIPPTPRRSSREHGYYLDAMVPLALDAGVSHVCTLDIDSFPIRDDWLESLLAEAPSQTGVVGVLRLENGDVALPHPSCVFAPREFFERYRPSFLPDPEPTAEFERFKQATGQANDTGVRLASLLWNKQLPWGKLLRTNAVDLHYLLGGIYGDTIFHMSGVASGLVFRPDLARSRARKLTRPLERLPERPARMKAAKRWLLRETRRRNGARIAARNRVAYNELRARLLDNSDALIAELRGAPRGGVTS
ncbi:MAG TPA: hypothetical protein VGI86_19180 [Acidimicrobiia bacterium]|jgi:hypothetical protein